MTEIPVKSTFRMGPWHVVPEQNLLKDGEVEQRIDHKHMQVLLCLLQRHGQEVSKEELLSAVWEGKAVSEDVLSVAVSQIRKALGDKARQPTYIKTISGVGYCLIAHVEKTQVSLPQRKMSYGFKVLPVALGLMAVLLLFTLFKLLPSKTVDAIAVLPLTNLTGSGDRDFLVDGVTETLISELARLPNVKVISKSSVAGYGETNKSPSQIGRELGVSTLVEGAVLQSGDALVISVKLIDAETDRHLWAKRFKGRSEEVLLLQEQAARALAAEMNPDWGVDESRSEWPPVQAYEAYLEGRYRLELNSPEQVQQALELFNGAIAAAPDFAPSYLGLALARYRLFRAQPEALSEIVPELKALAKRALGLDPNLARAHTFLANLLFLQDWRFAEAEDHYLQALTLNPNLGEAHYGYAQLLLALGKFEEALSHVRTWRELDPLAYSAPTVAWIFNMSRRYHEAITELARLEQLGIPQGSALFHISHLRILENMGKEAEAFSHYQQLFESLNYGEDLQAAAAEAFRSKGLQGLNIWLMAHQEEVAGAGQYNAPLSMVRYCAGAGMMDEAFLWLEKTLEARQVEILWMNVDPKYDPLRADPRFEEMVRRIGL